MPANLTGAFTDKKRRLGGLERQAAERRAALRARKNISGGNVGGAIGGIAGTAVALGTGNPSAVPSLAGAGIEAGSMIGKGIDRDEEVAAGDLVSAAGTAAGVGKDKDAMKALKELLGK